MKRNKTVQFLILFLLAIAGLSISVYLLHVFIDVHLHPESVSASICSINKRINCETVAASNYSIFLGIPLAVWGILFYIYLGALFMIGLIRKKQESAFFVRPLIGVPLLTVIIDDFYLAYLQSFCIKSICIFCFSTYIINILMLLILLIGYRFGFRTILNEITADFKFIFAKPLRLVAILSGLILIIALLIYFDRHPIWHFDTVEQEITIKNGEKHEIGTPDMPVKITEISDYLCPYCARASSVIYKILQIYKGKIYFKHIDYPLDAECNQLMKKTYHHNACLAAKAVYCAGKQKDLWKFHYWMFKNQRKLTKNKIIELVKKEKLNVDAFRNCLADSDNSITKKIQKEVLVAKSYKIRGTPTFIINGKKYEGYIPFKKFSALIKSLLNKTVVNPQ